MIKFRATNYNDKGYDNCGNATMAILEIESIEIPLCEECINSLREDLKTFDETIFCYKCKDFIMSKYGWNYGGSCKLMAHNDGKAITEESVGYEYCKDCMDTCENAKAK